MHITDPDHQLDETISGSWQLDPQRSSLVFRVGHFWGLGTVSGHFESSRGRLDLNADPAIVLTIDTASLQTGNRRRDRHLRSAAFFDAENHPEVRFTSDSVDRRGDTLTVRGHLAAGGRSIPVELDAEVRQVGGELEVAAATTAPHRELGMSYSPLGMISPRSELSVKAALRRGARR